MMLKLIDQYHDDKIIIVLDAGRNTFRNKLYSEYKANRSEAPEDLIPQFKIIREAIDAFGLDVIEKKDFEADDIIASYAKYGEENNINTIVYSSDKDLFQLLTGTIKIIDPMKNIEIDEERVFEKFGVTPDKITDVQALIGDTADNIPGVPGIGPKTASKLINEFGSFENLLIKKEEITNVRIKNLIQEHEELAKISHQLVILKNDLELPIEIKDIKAFDDSPKLNDFFKKYEFKSLIRSELHETSPHSPPIKKEFKAITDIKEIKEFLVLMCNEEVIACDLETDSLNVEVANIIGISIAYSQDAVYIPFISPENIINKKDQKEILILLNNLCEDESIIKVFHNAKYDCVILKRYGVKTISFQDTLLMSYFINNGLTRHNLEDLYFYYFGEAKEKFKDVMKNESKRNYKDFSEVPLEFATNYAAYDSYATLQLFNRLNPLVAQDKNNWIYYEVDKKLSLVLQDMESVGFKIDRPLLSKLELEIGKEIHKIEKKYFLSLVRILMWHHPNSSQ